MAEAKSKSTDAGEAEVQKAVDAAEDRGYIGNEADPTPNEHYAVEGVTSDKPTPETDEKAAAKAEEGGS